jgi:hypothetical protein
MVPTYFLGFIRTRGTTRSIGDCTLNQMGDGCRSMTCYPLYKNCGRKSGSEQGVFTWPKDRESTKKKGVFSLWRSVSLVDKPVNGRPQA